MGSLSINNISGETLRQGTSCFFVGINSSSNAIVELELVFYACTDVTTL